MAKIICGIYLVTNLINKHQYVGQSVDIYDRWVKHKAPSHDDNAFHRALDKYGIDNFTWEIIEVCKQCELDEREKYWIEYYNTYENGYNETRGGQGNLRYDYRLLVELWKEGYTCKEIEKLLNCNDKTITRALRCYEISPQEVRSRTQIKRPIVAIDTKTNTPLKIFSSINHALRFFQGDSLLGNDFNLRIKNHMKFHGYYWEDVNENNKPQRILSDEEFLKFQAPKIREYTEEERKQKSLLFRTVERPTREELKKIIRTKSFTEIGKQYGVCDNSIRKWCNFEKLPRTKREISSYSDEEWELI